MDRKRNHQSNRMKSFRPYPKVIIDKRKAQYAIKKASTNPVPALKRKLKTVFHAFIRERDQLPDGTFICICCQKRKHKAHLQAGHFYKSEVYPAVRYDEWNVNGQCDYCNWQFGGDASYERNLRKKIGDSRMLILEARKNLKVKRGIFEYKHLIAEYTYKLSTLKMQKP